MQRRDLKLDGNVRNDYAHSDARRRVLPRPFREKSAACRMQGHKHRRSADLYSHFPPPANTRMRESAEFMRSATRAVSGFYQCELAKLTRCFLQHASQRILHSGFFVGSKFYIDQHVDLREFYVSNFFYKIERILDKLKYIYYL